MSAAPAAQNSIASLGISLGWRCPDATARTAHSVMPLSPDLCPAHRKNLTRASPRLSFCRPAHRGRLRRRARVGAGCGVLRVWLVTKPPGGARATPPIRHYERIVRMHPCRTKGHRSCATPQGMAKAGSEPTNRRGGAPKGGHPRRADCASGSARDARRRRRKRVHARLRRAMAPAGLRHWPAKGASQAPERLSALRFPHLCEAKKEQTSGDFASRERRRAPASYVRIPGAPAGAAAAHVMELGPIGTENALQQRMPDGAEMAGPGLRTALQLRYGAISQCGFPINDMNGSVNNSRPRSSRACTVQ
jgi:hypothetical protein